MEVTPSITLLQEHSDHLRQLAIELRKDLSKLRLALDEHEEGSNSEDLRELAELAEVNSNLFAIFYRRLHMFLKQSKMGDHLTP